MSNNILFEEEQTFKRGWMNIPLLVTAILIVLFIANMLSYGDNDGSVVLLFSIGIALLVAFLLRRVRLISRITPDGIYVRFPPIMPSPQLYKWEEIQEVFIRKYNPLTEYGGWGVRFGSNGKAYNVSGNIGLQIVFKDGGQLLIGTNKPEEIIRVLNRLDKK